MRFFIATGNKHKISEFKEIFKNTGIEFVSANDLSEPLPEIEENGTTFEENALIKARFAAEKTGLPTIADDSGLCVKALNGNPGIYSARYAGEHGNSLANNEKLLDNLKGVTDRQAEFVCVIACVFPNGKHFTVRGVCKGKIDECMRGNGGFGYDPLFISDEKGSFGLISQEEKNSISHRANAVRLFKAELPKFLKEIENA